MRWLFMSLMAIAAGCTERRTEAPRPAPPVVVQSRAESVSATPDSVTATADSVSATPDEAESVVASPRADTSSVRFDEAGHPFTPIVLRDYCEGEDCGTHFEAIACLSTGLRASPSDTSAIAIPLAEGDSVKVIRRDLRVVSPGVVVMKNDFVIDHEEVEVTGGFKNFPRPDTVRLARNDTVYLLNYEALGRWSWALRGRLHDSDEFWAAAPGGGLGGAGSDSTHAVARSTPITEDWWLVQTRAETSGWWHGDDNQELQSISHMQHWGDDCDQVRKRS